MQVKDQGSEYHYNAVHRWYYDTASSMYYGGEPPTWTKVPDIPADAKYEAMTASAAAGSTACWALPLCLASQPCDETQQQQCSRRMLLDFAGEQVDTCQMHVAAPNSSASWLAVALMLLRVFDGMYYCFQGLTRQAHQHQGDQRVLRQQQKESPQIYSTHLQKLVAIKCQQQAGLEVQKALGLALVV